MYLKSWCRIETFYNFSVVKKAVGSISDGYNTTTAAIDVNAVHVSKCQANVCRGLWQNGEALVGSVCALGQA